MQRLYTMLDFQGHAWGCLNYNVRIFFYSSCYFLVLMLHLKTAGLTKTEIRRYNCQLDKSSQET